MNSKCGTSAVDRTARPLQRSSPIISDTSLVSREKEEMGYLRRRRGIIVRLLTLDALTYLLNKISIRFKLCHPCNPLQTAIGEHCKLTFLKLEMQQHLPQTRDQLWLFVVHERIW